ncbi:50S ribosomal protein L3 [Candidatus Microgenomates bacterium]|nr:50S ribosomal protein L3 [Candidatus Microgenomates bacterium]
MMKFLLGKKIGMTSIIGENGKITPITVVEAGPCVVTAVKTEEKDGYNALQVGFEKIKKANKPKTGHLKKSGEILRHLKEVRLEKIAENQIGDHFDTSLFAKGDKVKISGLIKGHGFTGPVKRYGFRGHPAGHGHPEQRKVGSIGSRFPQRTIKGLRMAGRWGGTRKTVINLEIIDIDKEKNLLLVKGSVPGTNGRMLEIRG